MTKKAFVFAGQGAQFPGMGMELYSSNPSAKLIFDQGNEILGFDITNIMFNGSAEELKQTEVTQPALYIHAVAQFIALNDEIIPDAVAGHSLGEFSALTAAGVCSFEDGLHLVKARADAMQKACDKVPGTMAAVLGLDDHIVEEVCNSIEGIVVAANYNCPGQLVISGAIEAIEAASIMMKDRGAKRAIILPVGGAFHSPLMEPAREELEKKINEIEFKQALCPIYQNVSASPSSEGNIIKENLIAQLTGAVKWTQTIENMIEDGISEFYEFGGNGKVLSGLIRKINREMNVQPIAL